MRRNGPVSLVLLMLAGTLLLAGCSRLSFVRPDLGRKGFEQTAVDVEVREPRDRREAAQTQRQILLARQALGLGQLDSAEKAARDAVSRDGRSPEAHTMLAAVLEAQGRMDEAGRHYRHALDRAPERGEMLNNYGTWLCRTGKPGESLEWFERALADSRYATPAVALANSGVCAHQAGDAERAARDLRRAIELEPENAAALGALAEIEYRAGRYLPARAFSERRLAAAPADAKALLLASQIERALGDNAAAQRYVQQLGAEYRKGSNQGAEGKP